MSLRREDFTLAPAEVVLKDGRVARLRRLSALERAQYLGRCKALGDGAKDGTPEQQLTALFTASGELVAMALIDAEGVPLFTSGADAAGAMSEADLDELCDHIAKLNHIGAANSPNA